MHSGVWLFAACEAHRENRLYFVIRNRKPGFYL